MGPHCPLSRACLPRSLLVSAVPPRVPVTTGKGFIKEVFPHAAHTTAVSPRIQRQEDVFQCCLGLFLLFKNAFVQNAVPSVHVDVVRMWLTWSRFTPVPSLPGPGPVTGSLPPLEGVSPGSPGLLGLDLLEHGFYSAREAAQPMLSTSCVHCFSGLKEDT